MKQARPCLTCGDDRLQLMCDCTYVYDVELRLRACLGSRRDLLFQVGMRDIRSPQGHNLGLQSPERANHGRIKDSGRQISSARHWFRPSDHQAIDRGPLIWSGQGSVRRRLGGHGTVGAFDRVPLCASEACKDIAWGHHECKGWLEGRAWSCEMLRVLWTLNFTSTMMF